jgi:hypothetical protein
MKNVKTLIAVALFLFAFQAAEAQYMNFGPRFGVNVSSIKGVSDSTAKSQILPAAGLFLIYGNNAHHKVSADLLYSAKGITYGYDKTINDSTTETNNYKLSFNYLEVPIQYTYCLFSDSSKLRVRASAGLSIGVRLNANRHYEVTRTQKDSIIYEYKTDYNAGYDYSPVDFGVVAGVGVSYMIVKGIYINFDTRFTRSLQNLREANEHTDLPKVHNQTISAYLGAGWRF